MKKILVILLFALVGLAHAFEVRRFDPPQRFWSSGQTDTVLYARPGSRGVVIFFPGGPGKFQTPTQQEEPRGYGNILRAITESTGFDLVVVNSPYSLETPGQSYPSLRESNDHLDRLEAVVKHYHQNRPVWLLGHSNGTFSVVALIRRLQKQNESNLITGMILTGARDVSQFDTNPARPVLFVHHAKDGCINTLYSDVQRNYKRTRELNSRRTEFVTVDSDVTVAGHPCRSGYHMMQGAYIETADAISNFIKDTK
jgi:pimeloyl-ACP methyl ester carboxylesterase